MKVSGRIVGANIDFKTNKPVLMLEVNERNDFEAIVDELKDKDKLSIEVSGGGSFDTDEFFRAALEKVYK